MNATAPSLPDRRVLLAYAILILFGGGVAVAIRFTVAELAPFWGAALRFAPAALIFWAVAIIRKSPLPRGDAVPGLILYGLLAFGLNFALGYWAMQTVEAGLAQILLALTPLFTFFLAYLHGLEAFRWRGLVGGLIATVGIAWAFLGRPPGATSLLPMLALIGTAACIAEGIVLLKRVPMTDPVMINAVAMTVGAASLLLLSLISGESWTAPALARTWISAVYLILFGSVVVFYVSAFVIKRWTASAASYSLVIMPFVTVALGTLLAGERLSAAVLAGGVVVLVGVWIGALSGTPGPRPVAGGTKTGEAH
jgi:drug/metabolite transporter (DMT)-like permease